MTLPSRLKYVLNHSILEIILVLLSVFLAFSATGFLTTDNLLNVLLTRQLPWEEPQSSAVDGSAPARPAAVQAEPN